MAVTHNPYQPIIDRLVELGRTRRERNWDSYDASPVLEQAVLTAINLVNHFEDLGLLVPPPAIGVAPDGGVVMRWLTDDREVDLHFESRGGTYSVSRRDVDEILEDGPLGRLDTLKDIVGGHVLGRTRLTPRSLAAG